MTTTDTQTGFESWAILELMGQRRLGGFVREVQVAGAGFLRIDVPGDADGETHSTQFYPPSSVYCLTPVSEAVARIMAKSSRPEPVATWEIPKPKLVSSTTWECPGCGLTPTANRVCNRCEEQHPCSCMDEEDDEDEGKDNDDDF